MAEFRYLAAEALSYLDLRGAARAATNEENRGRTRLKKLMKDHIADNNYPADYGIGIGECLITYGLAQSETIPAEKVVELYNNGQITAEQLAEVIKVQKEDAKRVLGADVVENLCEVTAGKEMDVRITKVETPYAKATEVIPGKATSKVKPKVLPLSAVKKRTIRVKPHVQTLPTRQTNKTAVRRVAT